MTKAKARIAALNYVVRHRGHTEWGGYPVVAITRDCGVLCSDCCRQELDTVYRATRDGQDDQWCVTNADVHWEGPDLSCDHCGAAIESAYGDPSAEEQTA